MNNSPLIHKVFPDKVGFYILIEAKVSKFIDSMKNWDFNNLKEYLPDDIIDNLSISLFSIAIL